MVTSSVNLYPTFKYSQPDEYRFSHDSVFLARRVFEILNEENLSDLKALDLCSGCGIVGLDFLFHLKTAGKLVPTKMDFLEVQEVYQKHFELNCESLGALKTELRFCLKNYETLCHPDQHNKYDLILSNPPYFDSSEGSLSPSEFKNRCRFFLDASIASYFSGIQNSLTDKGRAFILSRRAIEPIEGLKVQILEKIRGTPLYLLSSLR